MKRSIMAIGLCLLLTVLLGAPLASAIASVPTDILPVAPLMITSYKTENGGKDIAFLELYNSGNSLQKLSDWSIVDTVNDRTLNIATHAGYIEPATHVVLAKQDLVNNATFEISGWTSEVLAPDVMTNLQLVNPQYRANDMTISSKLIDKWAMRNFLTSGYSSSAFDAAYRASLFDDGVYVTADTPSGLKIIEVYPYASSCSPFDTSMLCGDYIKLFNASDHTIDLDDYVLRTDSSSDSRTNANAITLSGEVEPQEYMVVNLTNNGSDLSLTNSGGYIWLEDLWGLISYPDTVMHYESAGSALQGYSYAVDESDNWQWTSTPMPLTENVFTPIIAQGCTEGKYLNPETNRCRTIEETLNTLTTCEEGSERNLATNRCRKITTSTGSTLTPCKEGQVRNPETNRCRSIASEVAGLMPCNDGYERNPETNRCRKTAVAGASTTKYPVEPYEQKGAAMATWWAIGGIGAIVVGYGIWEWRNELGAVGIKLRNFVLRR